MNKFKVGDVVTRHVQHRKPHWSQFCHELGMSDGHPLVVTDILGSLLILEGCNGHTWDPDYFQLICTTRLPKSTPKEPDEVDSPKHYQFFPDLEAIEVIACSMTQEQFYGYCLGNRLKYRLRAGNKDKLEQDIAKSDKYLELYEQHRGKCIAA